MVTEWLDAELVRNWAQAGVQALREHRSELNRLNVFPVPDGDTGTNLYLTFLSAAEAEAARTGERGDAVDALQALARGARLGARGNSGIILAQVLHAFALAAEPGQPLSLAKLLRAGALAARTAVADPVEGTALTVLDSAAAAFAANPEIAASAARETLAQTPKMLQSLARAGVVDAGGRGVVVLLDALTAAWYGQEVTSPPVGLVPQSAPQGACDADADFELMFLVDGSVSAELRTELENVGVSLAITGDESESFIHIHCDHPPSVLALFPRHRRLRIEALGRSGRRRAIVQAAGAGNLQFAAEAGALPVTGEAGDRASVHEFVTAGLRADAEEVVLLPSDADSARVAEYAAAELQAQGISTRVVASGSFVASLAALAVFDEQATLDEVAQQMSTAADSVRSLDVARADRSVQTDLGKVSPGELLAFLDGQLVSHSEDLVDAVCAALLHVRAVELVTLLPGDEISDEDLQDLQEAVSQVLPDAEVTTFGGGQRSALLWVGLE